MAVRPADEESSGVLRRWRRGPRRRGNGSSASTATGLKAIVLVGPEGQIVCERCYLADRPLARLRGLMAWPPLTAGEGMLLRPTWSIHTAFVRFPIDAVFLDEQMRVLGIRSRLKPWRAAWERRAHAVLELPAGRCDSARVRPGDKLGWGRV